jgi:hypothetical protein
LEGNKPLGTDDHRSGISTEIDFEALEVLKMEKWCREVADERLAVQGLVVDDKSRRKLAVAVGAAVQRASLSLARLSIGIGMGPPIGVEFFPCRNTL